MTASDSARPSTAAESHFRIQASSPTLRVVKVIALDSASDREIAAVVEGSESPDMVVMVVSAGGDAFAAEAIGRACSDRRIMTTAIVVRAAASTDQALSRTLVQVRPWSLMVVVASDEAYVDDILTSFR
jgi:hypothetical protein